jgi:hypothetical protein
MVFTLRVRRWKRRILLGAILHLAFLAVAPFEHHDLQCHLKTPLHCAACASSPLSPAPRAAHSPAPSLLTDVGVASVLVVADKDTCLAVRTPGRSPPSFA